LGENGAACGEKGREEGNGEEEGRVAVLGEKRRRRRERRVRVRRNREGGLCVRDG
jgi:hypothetical protein